MTQRQTCKACGMVDYWDFTIQDDLWGSIVPPGLRNRVVCLPCFDRFAANQGIKYAASLRTIYFAGEMAAFEFMPVMATDTK